MAVLDASFLMDLERGLPSARGALDRLVQAEEPLLVPAQAAIEFLAGVGDQPTALHRLEAAYVVRELDRAGLLEAARLAREAFGRGAFPGWADAQIGALASLEATFVVTADVAAFRRLGSPVWDYRREREPPSP